MTMSQTGGMDVNALMQRIRRLAMLDTSVFDEVRTDTAATVPAIVIAAASVVLAAIGGWLWWSVAGVGGSGKLFFQSVILGSIFALLLWGVWIAITYVMLTQVFRARADVNELSRVMGFAMLPLALSVLMFIPGIDYGIGMTSLAVLFALTTIAVQTATDAPAGQALAATGAGFAVWAIVLGLLVTSSHVWAPGPFVFDNGAEIMRSFASSFRSIGF
ncbi:MAG: YIP1 family protein [Chloroflexota bacterium]|nr:YIP1 family protein [Chloroflexota bacterium]